MSQNNNTNNNEPSDISIAEQELNAAQEQLDAAKAKLEEIKASGTDNSKSADWVPYETGTSDQNPLPDQPQNTPVVDSQNNPVPPPNPYADQPQSQQSSHYTTYPQSGEAQTTPPQQGYYQQNNGQQPYPQQPYQQGYSQPYTASKDHVAAGLLGIFLGSLGIHKFYLGYNTAGFIMLGVTILGSLLTLGIAGGVIWIIGIIEGIMYLVKSQSEFEQTYVFNKREWF